MNRSLLSLVALLALGSVARAQLPVTANPDHAALLASPYRKVRANKKLVYDFWREVFESGHLELAPKYMAEDYKQHNPTVATGRAAFVAFFSQFMKPKTIQPKVQALLVSIVADDNFVVLTFVRTEKDPKDPTKTYTTTWFDMFRIENGKVAEHWDGATK